MTDKKATLTFIADDKASGPVKGLGDALARLQKGGAGAVLSGVALGGGIAAFGLLENAAGNLIGSMGDMARASMEEQAALKLLTTAVSANDETWDGNVQSLEKVIDASMKLAFTDDDVMASLKRLVTSTRNADEATRLNSIAMDLARLKGMSLVDAANLVAKAHDGQVGALRRAGIAIDNGATAQEALTAIQQAASGQAKEYADQIEGRLTVAQIAMNEAGETFGSAVAPAMADVMTEIAAIATDLAPELRDMAKGLADILDTVRDNQPILEFLAALTNLKSPMQFMIDQEVAAQRETGKLFDRMIEVGGALDGISRATGEVSTGLGGLTTGTQVGDAAASWSKTLDGAKKDFYDKALASALAFQQGILDGSDSANAAVIALRTRMESEMETGAQIAKLKGYLTGSELAAGLNSSDVRVRAAAEAAKAEVEKQLALLETAATDYGLRTGNAYADGIHTSEIQIAAAARNAVASARKFFVAGSPPGPESPLHLIDVWGERTGEAWGEGVGRGIERPATIIESVRQVAGVIPGGGGAAGAVQVPAPTVSGDTINVNLYVGALLGNKAEADTFGERIADILRDVSRRRGGLQIKAVG